MSCGTVLSANGEYLCGRFSSETCAECGVSSAICTPSPAIFVRRPSVVDASFATWPSHMRNDRSQLLLISWSDQPDSQTQHSSRICDSREPASNGMGRVPSCWPPQAGRPHPIRSPGGGSLRIPSPSCTVTCFEAPSEWPGCPKDMPIGAMKLCAQSDW
jgi:hypothetical protein